MLNLKYTKWSKPLKGPGYIERLLWGKTMMQCHPDVYVGGWGYTVIDEVKEINVIRFDTLYYT